MKKNKHNDKLLGIDKFGPSESLIFSEAVEFSPMTPSQMVSQFISATSEVTKCADLKIGSETIILTIELEKNLPIPKTKGESAKRALNE